MNEEGLIRKVKSKVYYVASIQFEEVYKTQKSISEYFKLKHLAGKLSTTILTEIMPLSYTEFTHSDELNTKFWGKK